MEKFITFDQFLLERANTNECKAGETVKIKVDGKTKTVTVDSTESKKFSYKDGDETKWAEYGDLVEGLKPKDLKDGETYLYTGGAVIMPVKYKGIGKNTTKPYEFEKEDGGIMQFTNPEVRNFVELDESATFVNESVEWSVDERFTDQASLFQYIETELPNAINKFFKDKKIPTVLTSLKIENRRGNRISVECKPITGTELGVFHFCVPKAEIGLFGGGEIQVDTKDGFKFNNEVWLPFNLFYSQHTGGSNGMNIMIPGETRSDCFYKINTNEVLTYSEAISWNQKHKND